MRRLWMLCVLGVVAMGCEAEPYPATGEQWTERFRSELLDADLILRFRAPPDMDPEATYPLVVQLDPTYAGLREMEYTVGLISHHAGAGLWPEAVVVGLDSDDPWSRRDADFAFADPLDPSFESGAGADRYYAALRDEVLPYLEASLPIAADRRVLVGHSNGAVFAWYAALRHAPPEAPLFSDYIAADAGVSEELFLLEGWHAERADDLPARIFATRAEFNGPAQQIALDALVERLRARGYPGLSLEAVALETDHGGAIVPSFEQGLSFVFGVGL